MDLETFVTQLIGGLSRGGLIFIIAAGLTLIFGALRVVNLAHGSFYMLGAYFATTIIYRYGEAGFWLSILLAPLAVAVIGLIVERTVMRRLYGQSHLPQILVSFALIFIVDDLVRTIYGVQPRSVRRPGFLGGAVELLGARVPSYNLFMMAMAAAIAIFLFWLLRRTRFGTQVRAAVDDREMLGAVGVNVPILFAGVFVLGVWLAGLAGAIVASSAAVQPGMDATIVITAFAVIFIGGFGSVVGSLVAAAIVGLVEAFGVIYFPRGGQVLIFATLVVVLAFRPMGLFGREAA